MKVHFEDRFLGGDKGLQVVVDVTECPVERPSDSDLQKYLYSGRYHQHSIKYEVGVEITSGLFVWFHGGYPGSWSDIKIIRSSGLLDQLGPNELVLADKIYLGEEQIITPFKNPQNQLERDINSVLYKY